MMNSAQMLTLLAQFTPTPSQPYTAQAAVWGPVIDTAAKDSQIKTQIGLAVLCAQVWVESEGLLLMSENFNYSPTGLMQTWPDLFNAYTAQQLGRTPDHPADYVQIANIAYANRLGNGPASSGDGWKYRGRGPLGLTGKTNYAGLRLYSNMDTLNNPYLVSLPAAAGESVSYYFLSNNLGPLADAGDNYSVSVHINGGTNGLQNRMTAFAKLTHALGVSL